MIRPSISALQLTGVLFGLLVGAGCSKSPAGLAEVSGIVKLDGKPLPGAIVTFYPIGVAGEPRQPFSRATTEDGGKYTLVCEDGRPGAVVGKHKVTVELPTPHRGRDAPKVKPPPNASVPESYLAISTTPLEKDVAAGSNTIPIEVTR